MPYAREPLSQLRSGTLADIATRLPDAAPFQRGTVENVLGTVFAGHLDNQLGQGDYIAKEAVPVTADGEYELGWAALRGVTLEPPVNASGLAIFAGNQGAPVFSAQQVSLGSVLYAVITGGVVDETGTVTVPVTALVAGSSGNAPAGATLTLVTPSQGIGATAAVGTGGVVGGADQETLDHLRTRMLQRYAAPPQGGALDDYVGWALAVPGVTRAWSYSGGGGGAIVVYFMMDGVRAAENGLPQGQNGVSQYETRGSVSASGDQQVVADALYTERAAGSVVYACAASPVPLALTLGELPVDATIRAAVTAAVAACLVRTATPGGTLTRQLQSDGTYRLLPGGVVRVQDVNDAIAAVPGVEYFVSSLTADVVVGLGEISVPGAITFT